MNVDIQPAKLFSEHFVDKTGAGNVKIKAVESNRRDDAEAPKEPVGNVFHSIDAERRKRARHAVVGVQAGGLGCSKLRNSVAEKFGRILLDFGKRRRVFARACCAPLKNAAAEGLSADRG